MRHALAVALSFSILAGATTSVAYAQVLATRTWVSGVGNDANLCSRTAPCLTFAGAISKTAAGGEIDVLDPGGFGVFNIDRAITIDGKGPAAGISAATYTAGIIVNAGNNAVVILRNLEINGEGTGFDGVFFKNGKRLIIENTKIFGFLRSGVAVPVMTTGAAGALLISNSTISTTIGRAAGLGNGIHTSFGITIMSHSILSDNDGIALYAENTGIINADSNVLTGNGIAVQAGNSGGA